MYAISDLHLANKSNQDALISITPHKTDWVIVAGDVGESTEQLKFALSVLNDRFQQIIWVPGNHDLWSYPINRYSLKGEEKYQQLLSVCKRYGVITPEDDYPLVQIDGQAYYIAPTFTLYDYSFRPDNVPFEKALAWATENGPECTDEQLLMPYPYSSVAEWCEKRCDYTEARLTKLSRDIPIILVNHYPVLEEHAHILRYPRFKIWCGTKRTEKWLDDFNIKIVVHGHMHIRRTLYVNGIKIQEVSLGYPRDWMPSNGIAYYLKRIYYTGQL